MKEAFINTRIELATKNKAKRVLDRLNELQDTRTYTFGSLIRRMLELVGTLEDEKDLKTVDSILKGRNAF